MNLTQDIGHGLTLIFVCAVAILFAVLIDLTTGVERAKKCKEKIKSRILRRTISKIIDYYRLLFFGVIIDVLGLAFVWYNIPYCSVLISVSVVIVEAISVLENYKKMKSPARDVVEVATQVVEVVADKKTEKIVELIKENKDDKGFAE